MKHLRVFENNNSFWLVSYTSPSNDNNYELYSNRESAENSIINWVNDNLVKEYDPDWEDDDLALTIEDAIDQYDDVNRSEGYRVELEEIYLENNVELDKYVERLRQTKKYNL